MDVNDDLISGILNRDNRMVARAISLIENNKAQENLLLTSIYQHTGKAYRIGITGPPGAGKSSITNGLIELFSTMGKSIAVIGVDPSSPFNHGSFLGDRVRMMNHYNKKNVFIRSMASRGSSGGLARKSQEVADVFDAAGYDYILFETVGVGQIELDVMHATDTVLVVLVPESGDDIQMMKAGLLEIADIFVINKSDRAGVNRIFTSLTQSLSLINHDDIGWKSPIQKTTATKMDGLEELVELIRDHYKYLQKNNQMKMKSNERYSRAVKQSILEKSAELFWQQENEKKLHVELNKPIKNRIPPYEFAEHLFDKGPQ